MTSPRRPEAPPASSLLSQESSTSPLRPASPFSPPASKEVVLSTETDESEEDGHTEAAERTVIRPTPQAPPSVAVVRGTEAVRKNTLDEPTFLRLEVPKAPPREAPSEGITNPRVPIPQAKGTLSSGSPVLKTFFDEDFEPSTELEVQLKRAQSSSPPPLFTKSPEISPLSPSPRLSSSEDPSDQTDLHVPPKAPSSLASLSAPPSGKPQPPLVSNSPSPLHAPPSPFAPFAAPTTPPPPNPPQPTAEDPDYFSQTVFSSKHQRQRGLSTTLADPPSSSGSLFSTVLDAPLPPEVGALIGDLNPATPSLLQQPPLLEKAGSSGPIKPLKKEPPSFPPLQAPPLFASPPLAPSSSASPSPPSPASTSASMPSPSAFPMSAPPTSTSPSPLPKSGLSGSSTKASDPQGDPAGILEASAPTSTVDPLSLPAQSRMTILPRGVQASPKEPTFPRRQRYEVLKTLGEGSVGQVILVKDNDIERRVAMKRLKRIAQGGNSLMRFVEEIQTIGRLEHPNIIPVYDVGVDEEGHFYFIMKYVEGETLESVIQKLIQGDPSYHLRYNFESRAAIFHEILKAMLFAHSQGVIHRDLKPANIMIGEYGEVIVMDWGLAKVLRPEKSQTRAPNEEISIFLTGSIMERIPIEELRSLIPEKFVQTRDGILLGTPAYMAPEQALGRLEEIDERSDIYSLCAIFYEFLTLRHYLTDKPTLEDLLMAVVNEVPIPAEQHAHKIQGRVPRELAFFLQKGLQKDPTQRPQTIQEVHDEILKYLEARSCVYCTSTLAKRGLQDYTHFLDNHRVIGVVLLIFVLLTSLFGIAQATYLIISHLSPD